MYHFVSDNDQNFAGAVFFKIEPYVHGLVSVSAMESILDLSLGNNFELTILFQPKYEGKIETRAHCSR